MLCCKLLQTYVVAGAVADDNMAETEETSSSTKSIRWIREAEQMRTKCGTSISKDLRHCTLSLTYNPILPYHRIGNSNQTSYDRDLKMVGGQQVKLKAKAY